MKMAELSIQDSEWIKADFWEAKQTQWTRTIVVLKHHRDELQKEFGNSNFRLMLLCGGDVVDSFPRLLPSGENLWKPEDVEAIIRDFGIIIVDRTLAEPEKTLQQLNFLTPNVLKNAFVIKDDVFPNDVSSTLLRKAIRRGESILYCTPMPVAKYIKEWKLYLAHNLA
uniref:Cytidyltransferase-like domain-containing protein n=1 Tax=Acrobeloides nanus TaxID=290746 RepID=A0A914DV78_9BILA